MLKTNIILIGMPGAGKSTVGALLSNRLGMPFIDTDQLIRRQEGCQLQKIIDERGLEEFLRIEEEKILSLNLKNHVIATGGSVVYSRPAMKHLRSCGTFIFLNTKLYQLERRLRNASTRGIAMKEGQSLRDLYFERYPLYKKYADIEIDCSQKHIEAIVTEVISKLQNIQK
jgi:shikimate kinase